MTESTKLAVEAVAFVSPGIAATPRGQGWLDNWACWAYTLFQIKETISEEIWNGTKR